MALEGDPLGKLSESIADGESIDWDGLCAAAPDDGARRLLDHLRIVASVAEVHRSQVDESLPPAITTPAGSVPSAGTAQQATRWGHLVLVRKIGEGAFGEVYEALDTWLDHPRALKLLKSSVASGSLAPQILHEARKLVRVRHPNVVMVHGADSHDGRVGFWMDLIEGQTLEQRVREGRLSPGEVIYVGQELCRALAAVHEANLLHRDIKAQNVMRASDGGRIILMDFGAGEFRDAPRSPKVHGTPLYLAPELLSGGGATIRSDIYALGVLLYYLVSGRFPVEGKSLPELVLAHVRQQRRHLRDARSDLPDGFVNVVERAIDPNPDRRFQSAGQFHSALEDPDTVRSSTSPIPIVPPTPTPTPGFMPPLRTIVLGALSVLAVTLILGIVACRTFEVALHVQSEFTAGPLKYAEVGVRGLLSFVMFWIIEAATAATLIWSHMLLGSSIGRFTEPIQRRVAEMKAASLAALVAVLGVMWWATITWWYSPMFSTVFALQAGTAVGPSGLSLFDPAFRALHRNYGLHSALLSFVLLFGVWRWWPALERRAEDKSFVRAMKWAPIAISILVIMCATAPRRLVWERFVVVQYKNQRSLVISTNAEELLLYKADQAFSAPNRVQKNSPDVVATDPEETQYLVPQ
jgi:Protein kinase domain